MRVLFVASGNSRLGFSPLVKSQGESLRKGLEKLDYFPIQGKGIRNYLRHIQLLKKHLSENYYDLIHAHYGLSCWVALLTFSGLPIIVSLMGDDAYGQYRDNGKLELKSIYLTILSKLLQPFAKHIIVKSKNLERTVLLKSKTSLIPNGVNLQNFRLIKKSDAREKLNLPSDEKIVLFLADPNDERKNFSLVKQAFISLNNTEFKLLNPFPIEHSMTPLYFNAADIFVLPSANEGSPNVIKEAMACNCPIVATDVGDIRWVIGDTEGCYIISYRPEDIASKLKLALEFSQKFGRTKGRERIIQLGLDSETVAAKIIAVYENVLSNNYSKSQPCYSKIKNLKS